MEDFLEVLTNEKTEAKTSIEKSIDSHMMSFAAESSRLSGKTINMKDYRAKYNN